MVSKAGFHRGASTGRGQGPFPDEHDGRTTLAGMLDPYKDKYRSILKERAKLTFVARRRSTTTPYQTFLFQEGIDNLQIAISNLESEIAEALLGNLEALVKALLPSAISHSLEAGGTRRVELPSNPRSPREIRTILYRMYRGGSFHPLLFAREVEMEFYRSLGASISEEGMRGKEIANIARRLVIRHRTDIRELIREGLEEHPGLVSMGAVRWSWRRGSVVRRLVYAPQDMKEEASRVISILNRAVARRSLVSGRTRVVRR
jgi:hypothetical protein